MDFHPCCARESGANFIGAEQHLVLGNGCRLRKGAQCESLYLLDSPLNWVATTTTRCTARLSRDEGNVYTRCLPPVLAFPFKLATVAHWINCFSAAPVRRESRPVNPGRDSGGLLYLLASIDSTDSTRLDPCVEPATTAAAIP